MLCRGTKPVASHEIPCRCNKTPHRWIYEDTAEAAITKDSASEFSNIARGFQPTRRLRVEISKPLQVLILFFRQKLSAHGRCHIHGAVFRFVLLPGIQRFTVAAKTGATFRTFR